MAKKKKSSWVKPVLIIGVVGAGVLFGLPVLMNYLRPGGTVNPNLPMAEPNIQPQYPSRMASIMGLR